MIVVIGAGALGSHVAMLLRNLTDKKTVVDFDKVEQKNTLAQFHTKMGLRKNKAQALSQSMLGMFSAAYFPVPHRLTKDNIDTLLGEATLILDCTDNIAARELIQGYATDVGTPCLHGALSADGTCGRVVWTEDFVGDAEGGEGEATCVDGEHLPFFCLTSSCMAVEAQSFLKTGKKKSFLITPSGITRVA